MGRCISRVATLLVLWAADSTAAADSGDRSDPALKVVGREDELLGPLGAALSLEIVGALP
jgi:hypothetical protein